MILSPRLYLKKIIYTEFSVCFTYSQMGGGDLKNSGQECLKWVKKSTVTEATKSTKST